MSGTVIITKYSTSTGSPASDALAVGEQAYSFNSDKLFIGETSGGAVVARTIGGQFFTDMMDHTAGTLTASSAVIVDANSKINNFNIGNITVTGATNTISSTNTNGNIVITPNGSGEVIIDGCLGGLPLVRGFTATASYHSVAMGCGEFCDEMKCVL